MIGDFDRLYRHMEHYGNNCSADEEIGFRQALKYMKYVMRREEKKDQTNLHLENKRLKAIEYTQQRVIAKLNLKVNDLEEDNMVLMKKLKLMNSLII